VSAAEGEVALVRSGDLGQPRHTADAWEVVGGDRSAVVEEAVAAVGMEEERSYNEHGHGCREASPLVKAAMNSLVARTASGSLGVAEAVAAGRLVAWVFSSWQALVPRSCWILDKGPLGAQCSAKKGRSSAVAALAVQAAVWNSMISSADGCRWRW
jgi:hypothetical protein